MREQLLVQPIRWAQKLARKNVGLNFLAFARRVAFHAARAGIDWLAAESWCERGHFIARIAVELVVTEFMRGHHGLVFRALAARDVDHLRRAVEKSINAFADDRSRRVICELKVFVFQRGREQRGCLTDALRFQEGLAVTLARLEPDIPPSVHALVLSKPVAFFSLRHGAGVNDLGIGSRIDGGRFIRLGMA
jgi:hypothetical protein